MPPRSPQPQKSRKPTTKKTVKKTVTKTRSGGVNAKGKTIKVKGDVVGRDKIVVNVRQGATKKPARPLKKLWHTYCAALIQQHRYLNLQGVGADPNLRVELEAVYVSLRTNEPRPVPTQSKQTPPARLEMEREPLTALEAASQKDRLVIVGDPGSGKSTFLSHLVVRFAEAWDKGSASILRSTLPFWTSSWAAAACCKKKTWAATTFPIALSRNT